MGVLRIILLSIVLSYSSVSTANNVCSKLFENDLSFSAAFPQDKASLQKSTSEITRAKRVSKILMKKMTLKSNFLKKLFKNNIVDLDFLCLGAGPQCASASLVLGRSNKTSLVVEKSNLIARNFAEKDFYINSIETDNLSMHEFPGGIGSLSDFTSQKYAHSSQLAAYIQAQQYFSKISVLLGVEVTSISKIEINGIVMTEVKTNQKITFRVKNLIIGTGLGDVGTKIADPEYQKEFNSNYLLHLKYPKTFFPIMATDTFLTTVKNIKESGNVVPVKKDIIVIGDGDGSRIAVEGFASKNLIFPLDFNIAWIGNNISTAAEYVASRNGGDRYIHDIVPFYKAKRIRGVDGRATKVELIENGRVRVSVYNSETKATSVVEGDMIIDTTGAANKTADLLSEISKSIGYVDVRGKLPEMKLDSTVLARQVAIEGSQAMPIYVVGAGAGPLASDAELIDSKNKNPMAMFNTVGRTSSFTSQLIGQEPMDNVRGYRENRSQTLKPDSLLSTVFQNSHRGFSVNY
jgi:hypothetical protein